MDRRKFLKWIPKIGGAAVVVATAPVIPIPEKKVEVVPFKTNPLGQEATDLATAAAICFGLRPRGEEFGPIRYKAYKDYSIPNLEVAENISNYYNSDENLDAKLMLKEALDGIRSPETGEVNGSSPEIPEGGQGE